MTQKDIDLQLLYQLRDAIKNEPKLQEQAEKAQKRFEQKKDEYIHRNIPRAPYRPNKPEPPYKPYEPPQPQYITVDSKYSGKTALDDLESKGCMVLLAWPFAIVYYPVRFLFRKISVAQDNKKLDKLYELKLQKYKEEIRKYKLELVKHKKALEQHQEKINAYNAELAEYESRKAAIIRGNLTKYKAEIEAEQQKANEVIQKAIFTRMTILSNNVLGPNDKNLETINFVIDKIENRRADSVKEALNLLDDQRRRESEAQARMFIQQMEAQRLRDEQWQRDREQWQRDYDRQCAINDLRDEAKRAADELERIRKESER